MITSLGLIVRIVISLAIVCGLLWVFAKVLRKPLLSKSAGIEVLSRQQLSRQVSIMVVKVADRALTLGVTESQITVLHDGEIDGIAVPDTAGRPISRKSMLEGTEPTDRLAKKSVLAGSALSPATWKQAVDVLRDRTARR